MYSPSIWQEWERAGFDVVFETGPHEEEKLALLVESADALLVGTDRVTRKVLENAKRLRIISKYGVGIDNIDTEFASQKGICVCNTPGVNTEAVADYTFALLLALARKIPQSHSDLLAGRWNKSVGVEIWGKTLGILGLGEIGKAVARRAKGFNMRILAYDLYPDDAFAEQYGVLFADLKTVLSQSDFISIHLALTEETRNLIGREQLAWMKTDSILINTARGGIVDEEALYEALASKALAGAGLDVFQVEPLEQSPLRGLDNVILTPHNASATVEAIKRMTEQSTENVIAFFKNVQKQGEERGALY